MILLIATNPERLALSGDELRATYSSLISNEQAIATIKSQLSAVSGMDKICHSLNMVIDAIEAQAEHCQKLYQGLDTICQLYASCENRIIDRCENALVCYEQPPADFVDLVPTAALLKELSFQIDGGDLAWQQDILK